jgi:hypothetical protein
MTQKEAVVEIWNLFTEEGKKEVDDILNRPPKRKPENKNVRVIQEITRHKEKDVKDILEKLKELERLEESQSKPKQKQDQKQKKKRRKIKSAV